VIYVKAVKGESVCVTILHYLTNKSLHWLTKLYSPRELRDFKELFVRTKNNIAITVERFPV